MRTLLATVFAGALAAGCYGTTSGTVEYSGGVAVDTPDLVYVSPGVSVIADYDEPIFYSDGYYWRENGGVWFRSGNYSSGWISAAAPYAVISVGNPYRYRHYRPNGYVARGYYGNNRGYYGNRGTYYGNRGGGYGGARDHRSYSGRSYSAPPRASGGGGFRSSGRSGGGFRGGAVRDHRR